MRILSEELFETGALPLSFPLNEKMRSLVQEENWMEVDKELWSLTAKGGDLFNYLRKYHEFTSIEYTIAIRDSQNPEEEDGIWHDDGSRFMAASLSLSLNENIEGGILEIKHIGRKQYYTYKTPSFGSMILFLTGQYGYLHKINKVTKGKRVIVAIWCS